MMPLLRRYACWFLVVLLMACTAVPPEFTSDVAALTQQAKRWDEAIVAKDRAAIQANMSDDFRQIDVSGNVKAKASFVEGLLDPALSINPYTVDDFDIRIYDSVALLTGRTQMTGTYNGKPFTSHYRYIDIYVRRSGAWKIVSVQITRVQP